jgi:hypothetical protein
MPVARQNAHWPARRSGGTFGRTTRADTDRPDERITDVMKKRCAAFA